MSAQKPAPIPRPSVSAVSSSRVLAIHEAPRRSDFSPLVRREPRRIAPQLLEPRTLPNELFPLCGTGRLAPMHPVANQAIGDGMHVRLQPHAQEHVDVVVRIAEF